jgi:hypothetical protein
LEKSKGGNGNMRTIGNHWLSGAGIEFCLFDVDPIDMEIGTWEIMAVKAIAQIFGFQMVLAALEISDSRLTVSLLNCHISLFWK